MLDGAGKCSGVRQRLELQITERRGNSDLGKSVLALYVEGRLSARDVTTACFVGANAFSDSLARAAKF